tara:strand:+ start:1251 stop:1577 length:327 start_codon:yes stop_codon:yes gene_type:complete
MRAGKLRNKATFYSPSSTTNEWGEVDQSYTELGTYACSITTVPRREYEESDTVVSKTEYDLRFRYYSDLASMPRNAYIVVKGITLEINAIANVMLKDREIQMVCEERS